MLLHVEVVVGVSQEAAAGQDTLRILTTQLEPDTR